MITKLTKTPNLKRLTHKEKDILIAQLQAKVEFLESKVEILEAQVISLTAQVEKLLAIINKDSSNSSKPPSSDPPNKLPRYPERIPSNNPNGGQKNHKGTTIQKVPASQVDKIIEIACYRKNIPVGTVLQSYQEIDIVFSSFTTEYRLIATNKKEIAGISTINTTLPSKSNHIIYSSNIQALISYLTIEHAISEDRTKRIFNDLFGISISSGFVSAIPKQIQTLSTDLISQLKSKLLQEEVVGADETFVNLNKKTGYIWIFHSNKYSYFQGSKNRNSSNIDWLRAFRQTLVHDRYSLYNQINCCHQLCTVHLQRNLKGLPKSRFRTTLENILGQAQKARPTQENSQYFYNQLNQLLEQVETSWDKTTRALYLAINSNKNHLLNFLTNPNIPHHNNGSERELRKSKVKAKVSGGFRTLSGLESYCTGLSVIQTCRKQGYSVLNGLRLLFSGNGHRLQFELGLV